MRISYLRSDSATNRLVTDSEKVDAIIHAVLGLAIVAFDVFLLIALSEGRLVWRW